MDELLCVDCLVEDNREVSAITVCAGYALCMSHVVRFTKRSVDASARVVKLHRDFVDQRWDELPKEN